MRQHRDYIIEKLKQDEEFALEYLQTSLEEYQNDNDYESFLLAMKTLIKANGGFTKVAKKTKKGRESLYKSFSEIGNPQFETITKVMCSLGYKFNIEKIHSTPNHIH